VAHAWDFTWTCQYSGSYLSMGNCIRFQIYFCDTSRFIAVVLYLKKTFGVYRAIKLFLPFVLDNCFRISFTINPCCSSVDCTDTYIVYINVRHQFLVYHVF
jgi:hypothetical protein